MNKRAIAILGAIFILIVGTLGFLLYQRQHRNKLAAQNKVNQENTTPAPTPEPTPPTNTPDNSGSGKAIKLTDDEIVSPVLFFQGNGITYFNSQGQLFQTDLQSSSGNVLLSNKRELTIALKSGIGKIVWPQLGNNFIAELGSGSSRTWSFYDSAKGSYVDLPNQIVSLDWLPSSDKIMLVYADSTGKATLNTANPDGSNYQTVTAMYEADDQISVSPDGKSILFWRTQNREAVNPISFLSPDGKVYKAIVTDGYNFGVKWSPDSQKFVFGKRDPQTQTYQLWLADLVSGAVKNLGVTTTPEKTVWTKNGQYVYAAVPTTGSAGNGLTQDTIMKINTSTLDKEEFLPGTSVDAQNLFLDLTENNLFFKNNQDRALYYIDISK
jgi:hypothetical protein